LSIAVVLILLGFLFVLMEAFGVFPNPRVSWGWLGLALWLSSLLIGSAHF
jgi:hypothetical protein